MKHRKIFSISIILLAGAVIILLAANANLRAEEEVYNIEGNVEFTPCAIPADSHHISDDPPQHAYNIMGRTVFTTPCMTEMVKETKTQKTCTETLDIMGGLTVPCESR